MHCPDGINGCEYIQLVAATAMLLSRGLDARDTFLLAEFLQSVSCQLTTLAIFKESEKHKESIDRRPYSAKQRHHSQ